jgi:hypothetical protein
MVGDIAAEVSDRCHAEQGDLCAVTRTTPMVATPESAEMGALPRTHTHALTGMPIRSS